MRRRRIAAIWLPRLATDIHVRRHPERGDRPLAAVLGERGRRILVAIDARAEALGLAPGMTLADARAVEPDLDVFDADFTRDAEQLDALAGWAERYTPWTAADGSDGVVLDITGCAHLFGGEEALLNDLTARMARAGLTARAVAADTPAAAWAVARFGLSMERPPPPPLPRPLRGKGQPSRRPAMKSPRPAVGIVPSGGEVTVLAPLPIAALRLPATVVEGLADVGLRRIGDLLELPRGTLAARFGDSVGRRLDQALARAPEPISPRRAPPPRLARIAFAEPIATAEAIAGATRHLLDELCRSLAESGEGARRLELTAFRTDLRFGDVPQRLDIGTHRPTRTPTALFRLFAEKLDRLAPEPGIEVMMLAALTTEPLGAVQTVFDRRPGGDAVLGELIDRLGNRLGGEAVLRLVPRPGWLPERSVAAAPPLAAISGMEPWPADRPRPVRLLVPPEAVEVMAPVPDDPPMMFRWQGALHRVRFADGPERIEAEWWRREGEARDYYRVEDADGRRFWIYRRGLYRPGVRPSWFLHGVFG